MPLPSISHHGLLLLWVQLLVLVTMARLAANLALRLRQPPVVGEIAVGVLLGPSLLGHLWPSAGLWLAPRDLLGAAPLTALAWVGAMFLLVLTGIETDLRIVGRFRRAVALITVGALAVPALAGVLVASCLPASFAGPTGRPVLLAMFMAISLSISSLPVMARILRELGMLRRDFAQIILGVGMLNDLIGWLALGFLATVSRSGTVTPAHVTLSVTAVIAIIAVAFSAGPYLVDGLLQWIRRQDRSPAAAVTVTLTLPFALAAATQAVGSDAVLGAYLAGVVMSRCRRQDVRVRSHLETVTYAVFAPLFFATAGLRMDLSLLGHRDALVGAGLILAGAVVSKGIGAYGSARLAGLGRREGAAVTIGLNARGAVEIVIATVGLSLGVLSQSAYTAIALMAVLTSVMTPPLLSACVRGWRGSPQEQQRLDHEESLQRNLLVRPGRLLLPLGSGTPCLSVANVLHKAWPPEAGVTIVPDGHAEPRLPGSRRQRCDADLARLLYGRDISYRRGTVRQGAQAVLDESELGYSVVGMALHSTADSGADELIPPIAMTLLSRGGVPLVALRCGADHSGPTFARLIVPVAGTSASRAALELALRLAAAAATEVVLLHVSDHHGTDPDAAMPVLDHAAATARAQQVPIRVAVRCGSSVPGEILGVASADAADLIVLGATLRRTGAGLTFSPAVQTVLRQADCAVAVVVVPDREG